MIKDNNFTIKDIAQSAALFNICVNCKKDFLQCVERLECKEFIENCKTAYIAIDMFKMLNK